MHNLIPWSASKRRRIRWVGGNGDHPKTIMIRSNYVPSNQNMMGYIHTHHHHQESRRVFLPLLRRMVSVEQEPEDAKCMCEGRIWWWYGETCKRDRIVKLAPQRWARSLLLLYGLESVVSSALQSSVILHIFIPKRDIIKGAPHNTCSAKGATDCRSVYLNACESHILC